jgi:hypothetical protein
MHGRRGLQHALLAKALIVAAIVLAFALGVGQELMASPFAGIAVVVLHGALALALLHLWQRRRRSP